MVTKITLKGLHCEACQKIVRKRSMTIPGVEDVEVPLDGAVSIQGDHQFDKSEIIKVLEGTDYKVL